MNKKNRDACVRYESYKLMEDKKSMHYFEENLAARKREKDEKENSLTNMMATFISKISLIILLSIFIGWSVIYSWATGIYICNYIILQQC